MEHLLQILNAPLVGALATVFTGYFVIKVYWMQKASEKANAAVTILFEVRNAENLVDLISEKVAANDFSDLPRVLPVNSWKKFSYLFAKDFDEDEFRAMNKFYNSCELIEEFVNRQNNFFWIATEQRGKTAQDLLGEVHVECMRDSLSGASNAAQAAMDKFVKLREAVTKFYTDEAYFYTPAKTGNGLKVAISSMQKVTTSTCGTKLKKLAR